jgi:hypothetical protein
MTLLHGKLLVLGGEYWPWGGRVVALGEEYSWPVTIRAKTAVNEANPAVAITKAQMTFINDCSIVSPQKVI